MTITNLPDWGLGESGADGVVGDGVIVDADGNLTTRLTARTYDFMWLPNYNDGTISKFDLNAGKELARYRSVSASSCDLGQRPEQGEGCTGSSGANTTINYRPSRAAVDVNGDLWVANQRGFVTKIAATLEGCVGRNEDGTIQTAQVVENGNTLSVEVLNDDECVLFSTPMCQGGTVEALAISKGKEGTAGDVWVGCSNQTLYKLDSSNGRIVFGPTVALGMRIGAETAVDSNQILWLTNGNTYGNQTSTHFQGVDTTVPYEELTKDESNFDWSKLFLSWDSQTNRPKPMPLEGCTSFGIAADFQGRVWFTGGNEKNIVACIYNPAKKAWEQRCSLNYAASEGFLPRGIAFDIKGNIYMSGHSGSSNTQTRLTRLRWNENTGNCEMNPMPNAQNVVTLSSSQCPDTGGVGFDSKGNPWITGYPTRRLFLETRISEPVKRAPPLDTQWMNPVHYFSLSDFTGYQIRNLIAPQGRYLQTLFGCTSHSSWNSLSWKATVPEGSNVQAYVRVSNADDKNAWDTAQRYGPFETSPVDLSKLNIPSSFLQLEFVLLPSAGGKSIPAVHEYEIKWACERTLL